MQISLDADIFIFPLLAVPLQCVFQLWDDASLCMIIFGLCVKISFPSITLNFLSTKQILSSQYLSNSSCSCRTLVCEAPKFAPVENIEIVNER